MLIRKDLMCFNLFLQILHSSYTHIAYSYAVLYLDQLARRKSNYVSHPNETDNEIVFCILSLGTTQSHHRHSGTCQSTESASCESGIAFNDNNMCHLVNVEQLYSKMLI